MQRTQTVSYTHLDVYKRQTEEQVQTITTLSAPTASTPSTQEEDKPNWVEVVTMILLGVLVLGEIKDKIKPHKEG